MIKFLMGLLIFFSSANVYGNELQILFWYEDLKKGETTEVAIKSNSYYMLEEIVEYKKGSNLPNGRLIKSLNFGLLAAKDLELLVDKMISLGVGNWSLNPVVGKNLNSQEQVNCDGLRFNFKVKSTKLNKYIYRSCPYFPKNFDKVMKMLLNIGEKVNIIE